MGSFALFNVSYLWKNSIFTVYHSTKLIDSLLLEEGQSTASYFHIYF